MTDVDLFGATVDYSPPRVPPAVFYDEPHSRRVALTAHQDCAHCAMNAVRWRQDRKSGRQSAVTMWAADRDVVVLWAVYLITQTDGSTLYLCAQHAQEHLMRGSRND